MHKCRYGTETALGVVHKANQLPNRGLTPQVDYVPELRMVMPNVANLNKGHSFPESVNYLLVSVTRPPFYGNIVLTSSGNNPIGNILSSEFFHLRCPVLLFL